MADTFRALVARDAGDGKYGLAIEALTEADLPDEDVLVDIEWSTLNYKDGLALARKGKIIRKLPMVCGVDFAGTVRESRSPDWRPGDAVLATGYGMGERAWGGFSQRQRVKPEWLTRIPAGFSARDVMAIGTAGFTAMLAVMALEEAIIRPGGRPVLVTGAAGGVGSVAVMLLARLGYSVTASTGRAETHDYLRALGADAIIDRAELLQPSPPLASERWAGAIDSVGGQTLATVLAQTEYHGAVAACGLAGGSDLPTTVLPFILRGVRLLGVDSVQASAARRGGAWRRLADTIDPAALAAITGEIGLSELLERAPAIVRGEIRGRLVVDVTR